MDFEFHPRIGVTIFALLSGLVVLSLAVWQISRFMEKSVLEDEWNARQGQAPHALDTLDQFDPEKLDYRRAIARGVLDESRLAIYDHHRFRGEPGCLVASPLKLTAGGTIIVVRGFVPHTRVHRCEDAPLSSAGTGELAGLIHTLDPNLADVANRDQRGATLRWDTFDVEGTYEAWAITDRPSTPTVLVLDEAHVGDPFPLASFEHVSAPYLTSMRHLNYAGTWLVTLLIIAGIWGGASMKRVDTPDGPAKPA